MSALTLPSGHLVTPTPSVVKVDGLEDSEQDILNQMLRQLTLKRPRHRMRQEYYDARQLVKSLGIAIPPGMENMDMVLGWPSKAVDELSERIMLDSFTTDRGAADDYGISEIWDANNMDIEAPQVHTSTFLHSCSFMAVTEGDTGDGEPEVVLSPMSGMTGTGLWNRRKRGLDAALSLTDTASSGDVTGMVMYTKDQIVTMRREGSGRSWQVDRRRHGFGFPPVVLMPNQPRLDRPFGKSRITRPVMTLADAALRTVVRSEVTAEFFSSPQRYVMGADESMFKDENGEMTDAWQSIIGRVWALPRDDHEEAPDVGQFPQISMQPHSEHLKQFAAQFSGETGVPLSSLGVSHDNPTSAEAIYAAEKDLIVSARHANRVLGHSWRRIMQLAWMTRENTTDLPDDLRSLRPQYRDPAMTTQAAQADALVKAVEALPWLGDTEVALDQLGWDQASVNRAKAEKRRARGRSAIDALNRGRAGQDSEADSGEQGAGGELSGRAGESGGRRS